MEYTIAGASNHKNLISEVNQLIHEGWQPIGGVAFQNTIYLQAMIRLDTDKVSTDDIVERASEYAHTIAATEQEKWNKVKETREQHRKRPNSGA